jgi:hypothetical protein
MVQTASKFDYASYMDMGPDILSQQPVNEPDHDPATQFMSPADWSQVFGQLESRIGALRSWRYSWWSHWSRLAEFFMPRRYTWLVVANRMWRGAPINDAIIDSTGALAVRTCAAGMWTGLTSPSRPWFTLEIGNTDTALDADGKAWLKDTQDKVYTVLSQSNFYNTMSQAFQDVTVFGTAPVIIYEDYEDVIRCYLPCAGEYYLAVGARLSVNTLYREFTLTVSEIVEQFGLSNCSDAVKNLWNSGGSSLSAEIVVAHAIEPNYAISGRADKKSIKVAPGTFSFKEIYWLKGQMTPNPLSVRGFHNPPFMAARWATVSNDAYGRSPCMDCLGDNKQVQTETRRKAEFIEKGVRPPMGANPELKNEPSSIIPGMITYMNTSDGKKGFWPLFQVEPQWVNALAQDIQLVSARIQHCLFVDLFMAISRMEGVQPRNELELTQRNLERLQELGPFVQMFENEFAGPAIRRILDIMQRRKMLKPMPPSLQGIQLRINYVSIMKLAQRATESVALKDVFQTGGAMSSAAHAAGLPDPLRIINLDKAMRYYAELNNFPEDCLFTLQEVETHDQAREKGQQQAQAPQQAMAAVTAAKTLSQTQIGGGNALGAMLGAGGGGGGAPQ